MKKIKKKFNEKQQLKSTKGITIITLVVTIIIILILAGVSIGILFNNEELFGKMNSATTKYNVSKEEELLFLQNADNYLNTYNGVYSEGNDIIKNPTETITLTPDISIVLPEVGAKVPEEGWTVKEAEGLVARDGIQVHIGDRVQYNPSIGGVWRIFYYDEKGYFGVKNSLYLIKDTDMDILIPSSWEYEVTNEGLEKMIMMNPMWRDYPSLNSNIINLPNERAASYFYDVNNWEGVAIEGITEFVSGSPSLELFIRAYNAWESDTSKQLCCEVNLPNGYSVGVGGIIGNKETNNYTVKQGPNNIFDAAFGHDVWLSSPCSMNDKYVWFVGYYNQIYPDNNSLPRRFRQVVRVVK